MPTRKEIIEELNYEIERLSTAVTSGSQASSDALESHAQALVTFSDALDNYGSTQLQAVDRISEALDKHGSTQLDAADRISGALGNAAGSLIAAVVLGGVFGLMGLGIKVLIERIREINKKTELIKSIQFLQSRYPAMSYEFVLDRSHAEGTSRDQRQTILNELIHDGLVTVVGADTDETISIDPGNPKLIEYWEWLDSIRENAINERNKLLSQ